MGNFYRHMLGRNLLYNTVNGEMPFFRIYLLSPFLYNLLYLTIFALFSGLLSTFVLNLSFFYKKRKIVLFIPVFVIFRVLQVYDTWKLSDAIENGSCYTNFNIMDYLVPTMLSGFSPVFIGIVILIIVVVSIISTVYAIQEDIRSLQ